MGGRKKKEVEKRGLGALGGGGGEEGEGPEPDGDHSSEWSNAQNV